MQNKPSWGTIGKKWGGAVSAGWIYAAVCLSVEAAQTRPNIVFVIADQWRAQVAEAIRQAEVRLRAMPCPAGQIDVDVGPGWNGVLLHEAVGHGLEGDFNRKGTSAFSGRIGQRVAARGVTVFDDGSIADRRGSVTIDDEGTPGKRTVPTTTSGRSG